MQKKVILIILDGFGLTENSEVSAVSKAKTPYFDQIWANYPKSKLQASGEAVGLPNGQFGNSEVGHMNLGAGRVVFQDLVKINNAIKDKSFHENKVLVNGLKKAKEKNKKVHLLGLVSDGGVHSHINHVKAITEAAATIGLEDVFIHAFTDGRDTGPHSGLGYLKDLQGHLDKTTGKIATIVGRYFAMDRDNRWERVKKAYDVMVNAVGHATDDLFGYVQNSYDDGVTDEFMEPVVNTKANGKIEEGDVVICFNYRTDRGREISKALTQQDFPEYNMTKQKVQYITMTKYDETFKGVEVMYDKENLTNTLGEWLSKHGKKQIRIAETEKYPHVTFFFSGGQELEYEGEKRLLCPSPKVATYDLQPEMSAFDIQDRINKELVEEWPDFVCLNFANPDMVGHTGVMAAAIKACETVDQTLKSVVETGLEHGYTSIVIADHGNADIMVKPDGSPHTAHTTALVPCVIVDKEMKGSVKDGKLGDLAPTILKMMGLEKPNEMTGDVLI